MLAETFGRDDGHELGDFVDDDLVRRQSRLGTHGVHLSHITDGAFSFGEHRRDLVLEVCQETRPERWVAESP